MLVVFALVVGSTSRLNAQKLEPGTWTGTVVDPGGESVDVTFIVMMAGDTIQITMSAGEEHTMAFSNVHFDDGKLLFTWEPGIRIDCVLNPADAGGYAGTCTDTSGESGQMTMVPPKKEG
jgi:hypothetical protein